MDASQQLLVKKQDDALDTLGQGVARVKALAGSMRDELNEQSVILESLEDDMDRQDASMNSLTRKLRNINSAVQSSERAQFGLVVCLLILLGILILMVLD